MLHHCPLHGTGMGPGTSATCRIAHKGVGSYACAGQDRLFSAAGKPRGKSLP
jgi:hypothetical protein